MNASRMCIDSKCGLAVPLVFVRRSAAAQ